MNSAWWGLELGQPHDESKQAADSKRIEDLHDMLVGLVHMFSDEEEAQVPVVGGQGQRLLQYQQR